MKKALSSALLAMVFSVGAIVSANAEINLAWVAGGGFYADPSLTGGEFNENIGILDATVNPLEQIYAQLIFGADGVIDAPLPGGATTGDDVVLESGTVALTGGTIAAGSVYGDFGSAPPVLDTYEAGNVYVRVFGTTQPFVQAGTFYYDGALFQFEDRDPTLPPETYETNQNSAPNAFGDVLSLVVVPEPGTMSLVLIGMCGLAIRRRRAS